MKEISYREEVGFDVVAKVISQQGFCGAGYKVGDEIHFRGHCVEGKACYHVLYSVLPKIFALRYGAEFPWLEDPDTTWHPCPDVHNPVIFEIKRIRINEDDPNK